MASRGLVVHQVEDVERVVDEGEAVVADGEQFVLDSIDQDPGNIVIIIGEVQLEGGGAETSYFVQLLFCRCIVMSAIVQDLATKVVVIPVESGNLWTNNDMSFISSSTATVYWVE